MSGKESTVTAPAEHMTGTMITNNVTISKILVENFIVRTSICKPIIMLYNKAAFALFHNHGSTAHTKNIIH